MQIKVPRITLLTAFPPQDSPHLVDAGGYRAPDDPTFDGLDHRRLSAVKPMVGHGFARIAAAASTVDGNQAMAFGERLRGVERAQAATVMDVLDE